MGNDEKGRQIEERRKEELQRMRKREGKNQIKVVRKKTEREKTKEGIVRYKDKER